MENRYEIWQTVYGGEVGGGPAFAKRIVAKFGTDTIAVIEDEVERLLEIDGIGRKRVRMICDSWQQQKEVKNIMLFLQDHGVSTSFVAKIYRQYGNESIDKVKENPFRLADDIWGIGFKTADAIAAKLGIEKQSYIRLRSGIIYALSELGNVGHVFSRRKQLLSKAAELLEAEEEFIIMTMDQMIKDEDLIVEDDAVYLPPFYYSELGTARKLRKLAAEPMADGMPADIDVARIEKSVYCSMMGFRQML